MAASSSVDEVSSLSSSKYLSQLVWMGLIFYGIYFSAVTAYNFRMGPIDKFGTIIHEFDPYFNLRATEYLYENGLYKFFHWFDHLSWYPLGRPVGTTIYPGMQLTTVFLKDYIIGDKMSINDICCYVPVWFGVIASAFTGLIAYECALPKAQSTTTRGNNNNKSSTLDSVIGPAVVGVFAMGIMSMIPAHLMRSMGGAYDNEAVAITSMTSTYWLWCRSLRSNDKNSHLFSIAAGISYFYMVSVWGGYIFVLNIIGLHAGFLVLFGRFTRKVYLSYSFFYVIGTLLAIQLPVVGWTPFKSLEQVGPGIVFLLYQILQICQNRSSKKGLNRRETILLTLKVVFFTTCVALAAIYLMAPQGFSSRVRGLFIKHTKTGNPLVDSVAEHKQTKAKAFVQYVGIPLFFFPWSVGYILFNFGDVPLFVALLATTSFYFSAKMVRLVILMGPAVSICVGYLIGWLFVTSVGSLVPWLSVSNDGSEKSKESSERKSESNNTTETQEVEKRSKLSSKIFFILLTFYAVGPGAKAFYKHSKRVSENLGDPKIVQKAGDLNIRDHLDGYNWIKDNTPEDARILAWWDYGYHITGISNRTTLADGNTWNHEHIALIGKVLTSTEEEGYEIARHLADYIMVWAGGGGDDLAKSPHIAKITNSVYKNHCSDPTCQDFKMRDKRRRDPSPMMENSLIFKLHGHLVKKGVTVDTTKFQEVHRSQYGLFRVYKILGVSESSKEWVKENRECDAGGWYCPGQYPPMLKHVIDQKEDFKLSSSSSSTTTTSSNDGKIKILPSNVTNSPKEDKFFAENFKRELDEAAKPKGEDCEDDDISDEEFDAMVQRAIAKNRAKPPETEPLTLSERLMKAKEAAGDKMEFIMGLDHFKEMVQQYAAHEASQKSEG